MRADFRNSAIARVSRFRDEEHREWRVVDAQCNRNGLVTAVFVPCTSANATHRFFIDDRRQEIRRYMFTPASAQELVFRTLLRQLHAALPVSWEPDVADSAETICRDRARHGPAAGEDSRMTKWYEYSSE